MFLRRPVRRNLLCMILDKFPLDVRPFYTMPDPDNDVRSFDLFVRELENTATVTTVAIGQEDIFSSQSHWNNRVGRQEVSHSADRGTVSIMPTSRHDTGIRVGRAVARSATSLWAATRTPTIVARSSPATVNERAV